MAANLNQVVLAGNLARDPEVRYANSGTAVCSLNLAVNSRVKKGTEWIDEVCFIDVTTFGKTAEACGEHLEKGSPVLVTGRLQLHQWETQDGQKRSKHQVLADKVQFLAFAEGSTKGGGSKRKGDDDDVPF